MRFSVCQKIYFYPTNHREWLNLPPGTLPIKTIDSLVFSNHKISNWTMASNSLKRRLISTFLLKCSSYDRLLHVISSVSLFWIEFIFERIGWIVTTTLVFLCEEFSLTWSKSKLPITRFRAWLCKETDRRRGRQRERKWKLCGGKEEWRLLYLPASLCYPSNPWHVHFLLSGAMSSDK